MAIIVGILGGLFSKMTIYFTTKLVSNNKAKVVVITLCLGVIVALFNYLSKGQIAGSGHTDILQILDNQRLGYDFVIMKFFAVLASFVSTIPRGMFMPSISIGAGVGAEISNFYMQINAQIIIIMAIDWLLSCSDKSTSNFGPCGA